ncbi:MAG: flagellar export chaperone FliS [Betaproteobacteria bacterium]|nr:flagellar export chaperone FliS [Betaproteobacteria bacterium]
MNAVIDNALQTYARLSVETGVEGASPEMLIVMLYDGAIRALNLARPEMERGNIPEKGRLVSKAIDIIDVGLRGALDDGAGGEIARNLASLYDYMGQQLLHANVNNDVGAVDEVCGLLRELKEAWETLVARQQQERTAAMTAQSAGRAATSYGKA